MFDTKKHEYLRKTEQWGSYGRNGDEPLTIRYIKDLSDEHLKNIIPFIDERILIYGPHMLDLMRNELIYRRINNISVSNYIDLKKFKFGR
jgi:hypothetical protein